DWRGFVWFGMVFGFVVSLFAILQHLSSNGEIYWFREVRSGVEPFGPYVNRNHFAGFAELILPLIQRSGCDSHKAQRARRRNEPRETSKSLRWICGVDFAACAGSDPYGQGSQAAT